MNSLNDNSDYIIFFFHPNSNSTDLQRFNFFLPLFKFCLLPKLKAHAYFLFFYDVLSIIQSNQALLKPASCDETKHWLQKVLKIHCFTFKNSYTCKLLALQALKRILSIRRKKLTMQLIPLKCFARKSISFALSIFLH